jgi:hypothetical protein
MQTLNGLSLDDWFKYHPPTTPARIAAHDAVNAAARAFAEVILIHTQDQQCRQFAVFAVQQARMFANQGITVDELLITRTPDADPSGLDYSAPQMERI